jgi:DNA-binding PadR family transcriptional regulator
MSIKHAILGLISQQPMHGYRLKEAFDDRMSALWGLTTGQIYQTLGALERAGLLASRGERVGSRPTRRIYSLTDAGKRELRRWLRDPRSACTRSFRGELPIRLMLLREEGVAGFCDVLARREHEARHLHARITEMPRPAPAPDDEVDVLGVFLDAMAHQLDAELKTLRRCREEVAKWAKARKLPVATGAAEGGDWAAGR